MNLGIYCNNKIDDKILEIIRESSEMNFNSLYFNDNVDFNHKLNTKIKQFVDYKDFIDNLDVVIFYAQASVKEIEYAIKHLKHIFLCQVANLTIPELNKIKQLADEANIQVFILFSKDYYTKILKIFSIIEQPKHIETNFYKNIFLTNKHEETILEMISEDLLSIISLNNSEVKKITTNITSIDNRKPDVVNVQIEFQNHSTAHMTIGVMSPENSHTLKIYDNNKLITVDIANSKSWIITKKNNLNQQSLFSENIGNLIVNPIFTTSECYSSIALKDFSAAVYQNNYRKSSLNLVINSLKLKNEIISKLNFF